MKEVLVTSEWQLLSVNMILKERENKNRKERKTKIKTFAASG
jgi:hypothetical protein